MIKISAVYYILFQKQFYSEACTCLTYLLDRFIWLQKCKICLFAALSCIMQRRELHILNRPCLDF